MFFNNWRPFSRKKKKRPVINDYATLDKVYTQVNQLTIGMYIVELDRPWLDTPFLFQGFELKTEEEIRAVREICEYVYIDTTKRKKAQNAVAEQTQVYSHSVLGYGLPPAKLSTFEKEILKT